MTCESGLEYLGLSHSIKCPVQEGRLKIVYSSLGKSPDVYKIGQQMSLVRILPINYIIRLCTQKKDFLSVVCY